MKIVFNFNFKNTWNVDCFSDFSQIWEPVGFEIGSKFIHLVVHTTKLHHLSNTVLVQYMQRSLDERFFSSLHCLQPTKILTSPGKYGLTPLVFSKKSYTFLARELSHIWKIHKKEKEKKKKKVLHVVLARELGWGLKKHNGLIYVLVPLWARRWVTWFGSAFGFGQKVWNLWTRYFKTWCKTSNPNGLEPDVEPEIVGCYLTHKVSTTYNHN